MRGLIYSLIAIILVVPVIIPVLTIWSNCDSILDMFYSYMDRVN